MISLRKSTAVDDESDAMTKWNVWDIFSQVGFEINAIWLYQMALKCVQTDGRTHRSESKKIYNYDCVC